MQWPVNVLGGGMYLSGLIRACLPLLPACLLLAAPASAAAADPAPDSLAAAEDATAEKPKRRVLFEITPLPGPDPRAVAAEGKIVSGFTITGNKITKEYVITRELELAVGEPFRRETMEADVRRLENLGIFSSVSIVPHETDGGAVDVEVAVNEMPWIIPYVALRITDQTGVSVGPAASSLNLLGRDITLSGRALFGGANTYQVLLDWPWITWDHLSLELLAAHLIRDDEVRDFEETSDEITPWLGIYLGEYGRLKLGYSYFRMKSDTDGITLSADNVDALHRLGARIGLDMRDTWVNPHRGWESELQVWRTGGDTDFWTADLDVVRYQPIGKNTLVLSGLTSLQTGTLGVDVPSYLDYVMGGSNSIRGYELENLGKELAGKNQLITTFEYQYLLWDVREVLVYGFAFTLGLELAAFVDTGIAWDTGSQFNTDRTRTGFGFGLRPLVPAIGEIRLDLGISTDGDVVFHLATWPKMTAQRMRLR